MPTNAHLLAATTRTAARSIASGYLRNHPRGLEGNP
jgi:hypothetical protein